MSIASSRRSRPVAHRLLFPALPPHAPLPLLAPSPDLSDELYDFIALALRAYVVPWWSKLSRYDKQLLPEITTILTAVIHALHARIHPHNFPDLLLLHAPAILSQHYRDYRNAHRKLLSSYAAGGAASLPHLFHNLQPHIALSQDARIDPEYFRHLLDHILTVCLPPHDSRPDTERFIVREIILKILLNDIIPKITQPWFIYRSILDLLHLHNTHLLSQTRSPSPPSPSSSFHTILVLILSAIQAISGACLALIHAYKQTLTTIKRVNKRHQSSFSKNYANPPLTMLTDIFTLQDRATSSTLLTTTHLVADFSSSFLDRLLPHLLEAQLSPEFILMIVRTGKRTLFPNGYPGPPPIEPTPEEQAEIRARLVGWKPTGALATWLMPLILGPDPSKTLEAAIDPLSSAPCNVHLVLFLLDLIILELFPELALPDSGSSAGGNVTHTNSGSGTPVGRDTDSVAGSEVS